MRGMSTTIIIDPHVDADLKVDWHACCSDHDTPSKGIQVRTDIAKLPIDVVRDTGSIAQAGIDGM